MNPLSGLYEHPFHENHVLPQDITYNTWSRALGAVPTPKFLLLDLNNFQTKYISQHFYLINLGEKAEGLSTLQSLLTHFKKK